MGKIDRTHPDLLNECKIVKMFGTGRSVRKILWKFFGENRHFGQKWSEIDFHHYSWKLSYRHKTCKKHVLEGFRGLRARFWGQIKIFKFSDFWPFFTVFGHLGLFWHILPKMVRNRFSSFCLKSVIQAYNMWKTSFGEF